jgi:hypothetical protein
MWANILLLRTYLKECEAGYNKGTCSWCLLQHYLQQLNYRNSQGAPLLTNGLRKCGFYRQWNFTQPGRRMKFCQSQINWWNWRTSIYVRLARLRRPQAACSPSYVDCNLKHIQQHYGAWITLRGGHTWEGRPREGNWILECGWYTHWTGMNTGNLTWPVPLRKVD